MVVECEHPDCEEEGEYYSQGNNPEVAACENHIDWAFKTSVKKPKPIYKDPPQNRYDDPYALVEGLRKQFQMFDYCRFKIEEIHCRPDVFDLLSRVLKAEERYEYDDIEWYIKSHNYYNSELKSVIVLVLDGIPIFSKDQGCKFSFGMQVAPIPKPPMMIYGKI